MRMQRNGARGDAVARQQRARGARIFAGDQVGIGECLERARTGIGWIAGRCCAAV